MLAGRICGRIGQLGDMDACLGFGDGAVIDLNLSRLAEDEQMQVGSAAGGDQYPLGYRVGGGADSYRNFSGRVAVVGDIYRRQPVSGLGGDGEDAGDGEVGKALVGVDPVREKPGEILTWTSLLQKLLERAWPGVAARVKRKPALSSALSLRTEGVNQFCLICVSAIS